MSHQAMIMSVAEIEQAIQKLNRDDLSKLRHWFAEYDADAWDRQMEEDAASGKLDKLFDYAREEHNQGRTKPL
jgi:hypothetical protein